MAQKPVVMEQIKQVRQLQEDGVSIREMARRVGISRNSVRKYLSRLADQPISAGPLLTSGPAQPIYYLQKLIFITKSPIEIVTSLDICSSMIC